MAWFIKSSILHAPVERVFAFHEREDALQLLTPAFPPARLISRTGGIQPGARVELQVGLTRWIALHGEYRRNRLFVDEQISGPFAKWVHRHEFESIDATHSRLTDRIEYELPGGAWVTAGLSWAVNIGLNRMFNHRHRVTRENCEKITPAQSEPHP
jgi:ligand-binding SRPBCC domain-containing protein